MFCGVKLKLYVNTLSNDFKQLDDFKIQNSLHFFPRFRVPNISRAFNKRIQSDCAQKTTF